MYSRALPNLKDILTKHRQILQANQSCKKHFLVKHILSEDSGNMNLFKF